MITWSRRPLIAWPRISSAMPGRVDVGRVEHGEPGLEADVNQPRRLGDVAGAPRLEEFVAAAERARAQAQHGDLETRAAELSEFHGDPSFLGLAYLTADQTAVATLRVQTRVGEKCGKSSRRSDTGRT